MLLLGKVCRKCSRAHYTHVVAIASERYSGRAVTKYNNCTHILAHKVVNCDEQFAADAMSKKKLWFCGVKMDGMG